MLPPRVATGPGGKIQSDSNGYSPPCKQCVQRACAVRERVRCSGHARRLGACNGRLQQAGNDARKILADDNAVADLSRTSA